ncbi:MAG: hypothetical protein GX845_04600 [Erysipelothrix sp.]|jgi:hypothetical protein|nr:hypothetical protein [Erysipelothrix sp.]
MKRKILVIIMLVVLSACARGSKVVEEENLERYKAYYSFIFDNDRFIREPQHYELDIVFTKMNSQYRYDIIIDQPIIAMYDIEVMVVEDDLVYDSTDKMMPNFGIFEDKKVSMIPNQVDGDLGYVKGVIVSGVVERNIVELKIMVGWRDYSKLVSHREFFIRNLDYEKMSDPDYDIKGGEDEEPPVDIDDEEAEIEEDDDE